ncbi:hypothetical protein [Streptomyces sp. NPDC001678]|uniref:hypothetical protein n=1 Tax=Streptomyces sp. NPDC001678 TaxID=3364599 RepID=UPI0036CC6EDE
MTARGPSYEPVFRALRAAGAGLGAVAVVVVLGTVLGVAETVAAYTPFGLWTLAVAVPAGVAVGLVIWRRQRAVPETDPVPSPGPPPPAAPASVGAPAEAPRVLLIPRPPPSRTWGGGRPDERATDGPEDGEAMALRLKQRFHQLLAAHDIDGADRLVGRIALLPRQEDWVASARRHLSRVRHGR